MLIDKMESVPGTKTALSQEELAQVNQIGLSVIGQSAGVSLWRIKRCTLCGIVTLPSAASR